MVWYAKYVAPHFRKPSTGLWGYFVKKALLHMNTPLEQATFEKLRAKSSENVLELGFGYGGANVKVWQRLPFVVWGDSSSDHKIGFLYPGSFFTAISGSGISYALDKTIRLGAGKMFGVDYSLTACNSVTKSFELDIQSGKLHIFNADVAEMPIGHEQIDKVFHTNCYYFWPDKKAAATEIKRVMKPGGLMVTGINSGRVKVAANNGFLRDCQWQTESYMDALNDAGFKDIRQETLFIEACGTDITFIYAVKP